MTRFTRGQALRYIRKEIRNYEQKEVAELAHKLWIQRRRESEEVPPPNTLDSIRIAISRAESSDRALGIHVKRFVCEVLKVDQYFIEHFYTGEKELLEELTAWEAKKRKDEIFGKGPSERPPASAKLKRPPLDIDELARSSEDMSFAQRGPMGRALDEYAISSNETIVLHVYGTTGSGKSTYLHYWLQSKKAELQSRPVIAINLENKSGDQVHTRIEQYLSRYTAHDSGSAYDRILLQGRPIIVLDSIERFDTTSAIGAPHSQEIAISDLIRAAMRPDYSAFIILVSADDNMAEIADAIAILKTTAGAAWREIPFAGISMRDALKFLENKKVCRSDEERRSVVGHLHHNAALINAYAIVKTEDNFSLIDQPLNEKLRSENQVRVRIEGLAEIFDVLRQEKPYEYLVFAILASSHEGLSVDDVGTVSQALIECGWPWSDAIKVDPTANRDALRAAMKQCSEGALSHQIRFSTSPTSVRRVPEGAMKPRQEMFRTLHYLAKEAIQVTIRKSLPPHAVAFLHFAIAVVLSTRTPSGREHGYTPFVADIEYFHALIFHLLSMHDLQQGATGRPPTTIATALAAPISNARDPKLATQVLRGTLSLESSRGARETFLNSLYSDIMRKTLFREEHSTSRQLGHYERKLAMLSLFLTDRGTVTDADLEPRTELNAVNQRALLLDIVVCANHCGKLSIAHAAARTLTRKLESVRYSLREFTQVISDAYSSKDDRQIRELNSALNEHSNYLVAISTTYFRQGDLQTAYHLLEREISGIVEQADKQGVVFPATPELGRDRRDYIWGILVSYRRLVAKYGQICSAIGKKERAEAAYRVAARFELQRSPTAVPHRGESGRNYIRMLTTYGLETDKARDLLEANIKFSSDRQRFHEIIEWYVERAWLALLEKRAHEIADSLETITNLTNEHQLQVSYTALREIELLSLILQQRMGERTNRRDLDVLIQTLRRSGHKLLLLEALRYRNSISPRDASSAEVQQEIEQLIAHSGVNADWLRI